MATKLMQFKLGKIVATPGALASLESNQESPLDFIAKHAACNYGTVCSEDWEANNQAIKDGSRILSSYLLKDGTALWLITEAVIDDKGTRPLTTLLLKSEY